MASRDSRDAWAGIVELDDDNEAKPSSSQSQQLPNKTLSHSDTDVDNLPATTGAILQRQTTQKDPMPTPPQRKAMTVRRKPIVERKATAPKAPQDRPSIELPLPEDGQGEVQQEEHRPSMFPEHESLAELQASTPPTWQPEIKSSWKEYREVGLVFAIGILTAITFLVLRPGKSPQQEASIPKAKSVAGQRLERIRKSRAGQLPKSTKEKKTSAAVAEVKNARDQETKPAEANEAKRSKSREAKPAEESSKAVAPMLSILSRPLGALVEIEGTVYGKTPLIRMSPRTEGPMSIKLRLSHHKNIETVIHPNEDGHYEANLNLELK
jgi:hypothetical protein